MVDDKAPDSPIIAGNFPDPDAQTLDDLVESAAVPPTPSELPKAPAVTKADPAPAPITRTMTGTITVLKDWAPVLLCPADPDRLTLTVWSTPATADEVVLMLSDDAGKVQNNGAAALPLPLAILVLTPHTGPVWVSCPDATTSVRVSYLAVTR